jgi:hypothetical protein
MQNPSPPAAIVSRQRHGVLRPSVDATRGDQRTPPSLSLSRLPSFRVMRTREQSCSYVVVRFYHVFHVPCCSGLAVLAPLDPSVASEWPHFTVAPQTHPRRTWCHLWSCFAWLVFGYFTHRPRDCVDCDAPGQQSVRHRGASILSERPDGQGRRADIDKVRRFVEAAGVRTADGSTPAATTVTPPEVPVYY